MNRETLLVDENILDDSQRICCEIDDSDCRNRAIADVFASKLAKDYFEELKTDTASGLHNIPQILEDIDISDIYVQDSFIDVRLYFNDNELCVPKIHFDKNILPVAYMFIRLNEGLSEATVTGFINPSSVNRSTDYNGYYKVDSSSLLSFYDVEPLLTSEDDDEISEELERKIYDYIDGTIDDKYGFYSELLSSRTAREMLIKAYNASKALLKVAESVEPDIQDNMEEAAEDLLPSEDNNDVVFAPLDSSEEFIVDSGETILEETDEIQEFEDLGENILEETVIDDTGLELDNNEETVEEFVEQSDDDFIFDNNTEEVFETKDLQEIPNEEVAVEDGLSDLVTDDFESEDISENISGVIPEDNGEGSIYDIITDTQQENSEEQLEIIEPEVTGDLVEEDQEIVELPAEEIVAETEPETEENLYSTDITPSINSIENEKVATDDLEAEIEATDENTAQSSESIDELFENNDNNDGSEVNIDDDFKPEKKKKSLLPVIGVLVLAGALGYFGYSKYSASNLPSTPAAQPEAPITQTENNDNSVDAMPTESIENVVKDTSKNEGNAVSIPAIEKNLDASILVSNLSVNWEVPAAYLSSNTAQRYFKKIGKVIQLKLKTELLLLTKPPINNKIVLELEYNKNAGAFTIKNVVVDSGESVVDNLIKRTVEDVLKMNFNINLDSFGNMSGNPLLVIKL